MKTIIIKISGMHCAACSSGVERSIKKVTGVDRVEVNLATQSAFVRYDETLSKVSDFDVAIEKMGFSVIYEAPGEEATVEQRTKKDALDLKRRLKVAACFFVPLIYIAMAPMIPGNFFPVFFNPDDAANIFSIIQLFLVLPIMYVGIPFFRNGIISLKNGVPSMDTLVALGTGAAFLYSLYSTYEVVSEIGRASCRERVLRLV